MQFMIVYTFTAENRDAVIKRYQEKGEMVSTGAKILSEWVSAAGHRIFRVIETEDPKAMMAATLAWSDLGYMEMYPIVPVAEVMKIIASRK
jgi:uncharacterized protein with GYD domain